MTMMAATRSRVASTLRMRNARNAADTTKNASSANIVELHGENTWS